MSGIAHRPPTGGLRALARRVPPARWVVRRTRQALHRARLLAARRRYAGNPRAYWLVRGRVYLADEAHLLGPGGPSAAQERYLARRLAALAPASALEVGCGYGRLLHGIATHLPVLRLVGVDFSLSQLQRARRYAPVAPVLCADGLALPFTDRSFDLVYTAGVMMHVPPAHDTAVRRELLRVARRYVAHVEDETSYEHAWARDHAAPYRRWGHTILLEEWVPVVLDPGQRLRLVIIDARRG